jgi:hypothetical protein
VPGAANPAIHVTPNGIDTVDGATVEEATDVEGLDVGGAEECEEELQLDASTPRHTTATAAGRT